MNETKAKKDTIHSSRRTNVTREPARGNATDFDNLLWRLAARAPSTSGKGTMIAMTSCCRKSGVSTAIANLAIKASINHLGPVLLIDANLHAPRHHKTFRQKGVQGLADVLIGGLSPAEATHETKVAELSVMPLGSKESFFQSRVEPRMFQEVCDWAKLHFATIFLDLPPIDELHHALMLARQADTCVVAIKSESVRREQVKSMIDQLAEDGVHVDGCILTRKRLYTPAWIRRFF
jgi:Mrp family chromosome partitioning ATPase